MSQGHRQDDDFSRRDSAAVSSVRRDEARSHLWLLDSHGLVHTERANLEPFKQKYAQDFARLSDWELISPGNFTLMDVVKNARPTILLGTSAQPGAFTEDVVREMARFVERPIIFPLSNPTSKSEARPAHLINWTEGRALVATGSPFAEVEYDGRRIHIGQCNNSFIFPGVGLGVIATGARRVTNEMFVASARVLAEFSPALKERDASLYPRLENVREVSRNVAIAVGLEAQRCGLAEEMTQADLERRVESQMWRPRYVPFRREKV